MKKNDFRDLIDSLSSTQKQHLTKALKDSEPVLATLFKALCQNSLATNTELAKQLPKGVSVSVYKQRLGEQILAHLAGFQSKASNLLFSTAYQKIEVLMNQGLPKAAAHRLKTAFELVEQQQAWQWQILFMHQRYRLMAMYIDERDLEDQIEAIRQFYVQYKTALEKLEQKVAIATGLLRVGIYRNTTTRLTPAFTTDFQNTLDKLTRYAVEELESFGSMFNVLQAHVYKASQVPSGISAATDSIQRLYAYMRKNPNGISIPAEAFYPIIDEHLRLLLLNENYETHAESFSLYLNDTYLAEASRTNEVLNRKRWQLYAFHHLQQLRYQIESYATQHELDELKKKAQAIYQAYLHKPWLTEKAYQQATLELIFTLQQTFFDLGNYAKSKEIAGYMTDKRTFKFTTVPNPYISWSLLYHITALIETEDWENLQERVFSLNQSQNPSLRSTWSQALHDKLLPCINEGFKSKSQVFLRYNEFLDTNWGKIEPGEQHSIDAITEGSGITKGLGKSLLLWAKSKTH